MATASSKTVSVERPIWEFGTRHLEIPADAHTYKGFLRWMMADAFPEKLHATYYDSCVEVDMSEEAVDTHAEVKAGIYRTMLPLVAKEDFGRMYADGILYGNPAAKVSTNPDGLAARWQTLESGRLSFVVRNEVRRALEGTPDWIMEILSDTSVKKDTVLLREAYHRAGIQEYWLIDARGKAIEFQVLCWNPDSYRPMPFRGGWVVSPVFGYRFRLTRVQDRMGMWLYTLEAKRTARKS